MSARSKNKKTAIVTVIVILIIIAASGALIIPHVVGAKNNSTNTQSTSQTRTITVGTQDIKQAVSGSGEIVTGDQETLEADSDKTVDTISAVEGKAVKKGAVLLTYTDETTITAPFNGVIGKVTTVDTTTETKQNSNTATDSIVIMNTDYMVTDLSVDETDLSNIKVGQKADITINAYSSKKYTGKVESISETGTYENGSSKFNVKIKLDSTSNVKIGMSAAVEIVVKSVTNAVAVPIEAVKGSGNNASVMLVNSDGTITASSVSLGLANDAYVQITKGLSSGDTIQYTVQSSSSSSRSGLGSSGLGSGMFGQNGGMQGRNSSNTNRPQSGESGTK